MKKIILLAASHTAVLAFGFALGIYMLPILTAPDAPTQAEVMQTAKDATYTTTFKRDLKGSDAFHWGDGELSIGSNNVSFMGELAPGPDYILYLAPKYVEDEAEFTAVKEQSVQVGNVKTFDNFIVNLPESINPADYTTAVVWCESFGEFISAGKYR